VSIPVAVATVDPHRVALSSPNSCSIPGMTEPVIWTSNASSIQPSPKAIAMRVCTGRQDAASSRVATGPPVRERNDDWTREPLPRGLLAYARAAGPGHDNLSGTP
jgi:hypothetical protein